MTTILSHQEDLGPSMLDVKYEGLLGDTGLVTSLNMAPNLSECNVSHGGIAHIVDFYFGKNKIVNQNNTLYKSIVQTQHRC